MPEQLAVAGGDAAGGAGVPVAHPGRGAGAGRGVRGSLRGVCARDEKAGPVRLVTPAFVGAHLGATSLIGKASSRPSALLRKRHGLDLAALTKPSSPPSPPHT